MKCTSALVAGVAQWTEQGRANQKFTGWIPSQSTCLGCGPDSQFGASERQRMNVSLTHINVCLPLFLPPFPSL